MSMSIVMGRSECVQFAVMSPRRKRRSRFAGTHFKRRGLGGKAIAVAHFSARQGVVDKAFDKNQVAGNHFSIRCGSRRRSLVWFVRRLSRPAVRFVHTRDQSSIQLLTLRTPECPSISVPTTVMRVTKERTTTGGVPS